MRVVKHPYGPENAHKKAITYEIPDTLIPKPALYTFRLFMFSGSDFGSRGPQQTGKGEKKYGGSVEEVWRMCRKSVEEA